MDTGLAVLKLGKFWANWEDFVYTLASFLFPKWANMFLPQDL